jgi:hypothetical protein
MTHERATDIEHLLVACHQATGMPGLAARRLAGCF